jgi:hypothetical protein
MRLSAITSQRQRSLRPCAEVPLAAGIDRRLTQLGGNTFSPTTRRGFARQASELRRRTAVTWGAFV